MSSGKIPWEPWLDDMDRIQESLDQAVKLVKEDPASEKGIEDIKVALHSIKGLFDSVGLRNSTQTIFEVEESVHKSEGTLAEETVSTINKAYLKLRKLISTIRDEKPTSAEVAEVDLKIGFESILVKFGKKFKVEIEVKAKKSLRSARALAIINSMKRFAQILECTPSQEDLFLDSNFNLLQMTITSREEMESIQNMITVLPSVGAVNVEEFVDLKEEQADLSQNLTIRIPLSDIRTLENGLSTLSMHIEALKSEVTTTRGLEELSGIDRAFERIQSDLRRMRKVPIDSIITTLPAMVKRLAEGEGKDAELFVQGRFVTVDRALANILVDPITQIVRNSVSHGIEKRVERRKSKKNMVGRITIVASTERSKVQIQIRDDGTGFDVKKIKKRALDLHYDIPKDATDQDIINLIFERGFSLSTDKLSGRGIGLSNSREIIEQIGGKLTAFNNPDGNGATFQIELSDPDALSKNLIFLINNKRYALPTSEIEEVTIVQKRHIKMETETSGIYEYVGNEIPVILLRNILGDKASTNVRDNEIVVVSKGEESLIGLVIDEIEDERLVNIRPLNSLMKNFALFNGSISGRGIDREIILVLNPEAIV